MRILPKTMRRHTRIGQLIVIGFVRVLKVSFPQKLGQRDVWVSFKGTVNPLEVELLGCASKAFKLDLAFLLVHWVQVKVHRTGHVKVDPFGKTQPRVVVNPDGRRGFEISRSTHSLCTVDEDVCEKCVRTSVRV